VDLYGEARRRGLRPKILVTRLRYLGDIVLSTPVISSLKRCYPDAEIHYLAEAPYAQVLKANPHLAGIIPLEKGARGSIETVARLRRTAFTAAIDLFYNPRSAWLLFLAGIPIRIGGSRRWRRRLYSETYSVPRGVRSAISHHLFPLGLLDCRGVEEMPRIYLTEEERSRGAALVREAAGSGGHDRIVAVHPGGTWPAKRWPPVSFARLIALLVDRIGARALLVTGPGEEAIVREVAVRAGGNASILPRQSIRSLAAVLDSCLAVVANDGGVMHMAVALERPTVGVFGPTEPDIWFPYEGRGPYILVTRNEECAPCHRHQCADPCCLEGIEPEEVASKVLRVIEGRVA